MDLTIMPRELAPSGTKTLLERLVMPFLEWFFAKINFYLIRPF
jgi:hypothetical protein